MTVERGRKKTTCVIATVKPWNIKEARVFMRRNPSVRARLVTRPKGMSYAAMKKINPDYVFFPHWSRRIPEKVHKNFTCVVFHMTDLPYGRGGTPLQNLIIRKARATKISAIKASDEIDAGPVYLKKGLRLDGTAEEIYRRASRIIFGDMIPRIIRTGPSAKPQKGRVTRFKRLKAADGRLPLKAGLDEIYDRIRMLDADGYPKAFVKHGRLVIRFSSARRLKNAVEAKVTVTFKEAI